MQFKWNFQYTPRLEVIGGLPVQVAYKFQILAKLDYK